jgi:hypothetical protein
MAQFQLIFSNPEDGGSTILGSVGTNVPDRSVTHSLIFTTLNTLIPIKLCMVAQQPYQRQAENKNKSFRIVDAPKMMTENSVVSFSLFRTFLISVFHLFYLYTE